MTQNMFSSEVELDKFLGSIDIIPYAFRAIVATSSAYELHTTPSGIKVLAFKNCSFEDTTRFLNKEFDLVSLENHETVDFISTKVNPKVSINGAAIQLFDHLSEDLKLKQLEKQHIKSPLIITGWGLGGYLAILFALRLQRAIDVEESNGEKRTKRPVCITFGAPLVGDVALQKSISERPMWKSNFLNVVAKMDPVASFFSSSSLYKPFGTFMFCTEAGGHSVFEDEEAILAVLDDMARSNIGKVDMYNYGNIMSSMRRKPLYRGVSKHIEFNLNYLSAGITLQFKEVGVVDNMYNTDLVRNLEAKQVKMIKTKKIADKYEPTMKLNDSKISLTFMEWYMKNGKSKGGYYDCFKENAQSREEIERKEVIVMHQRRLNQYYKKFIAEKELMPQKEGAKLRKRWLLSGNNYRMIVEPLDIADHYRKGNTNYIAIRPTHYKLIEKWYNEDKPKQSEGKRTKAASLTEDSCFWAHVEEASISLKKLRGGSSNNVADIENRLESFEEYVKLRVNEYSVSPDIFLKGSSLMKWWGEYKEYKGTSYASEFANYMNNKSYETYH